MSRITQSNVRNLFALVIKEFGSTVATEMQEGAYALDYSNYGGWVVVQFGERGSHHHPFGELRRSTREMWECLHFALRMLEEQRRTAR